MTENKTAYIVAAGPVEDYNYIKSMISDDAFIICADGGIKHCKALNITPNLIISDFDSSHEELFDCEVLKYPSEKDDTDFSLSVKKAIQLGYKNIIAFGALGGRIDHTIGAIQMLEYCLKKDVTCTLADRKNRVQMICGETEIPVKSSNENVSIFSYSPICEGVTLKGMKYPLKNATLTSEFPLGISNKATEDAKIYLKKGTMLIVFSQD